MPVQSTAAMLMSSANRALSNAFQSLFVSHPQNAKSFDSPLFDTDAHSNHMPHLALSMRLTSDIVASSVRSSLRRFNPTNPTKSDCRVLIVGSHANLRARYLSLSKDFPSDVYQLNPQKQQEHGGIYYSEDNPLLSDDESELAVKIAPFDAIMVFNLNIDRLSESDSMNIINKLLTPAGAFAGTGLFHCVNDCSDYNDSDSENDMTDRGDDRYQCSLRAFRDRIESHGLFVHTCVDLSLEGSLVSHVLEDARTSTHSHSLDELELYEAGCVLTGRFLATKASYRKPKIYSECLSPMHKLNSVEDEVYELSLKLSNNLHSLTAVRDSRQLRGNGSISTRAMSRTGYSIDTPLSGSSLSLPSLQQREPIVVTGISLGLPNGLDPSRKVFDSDNFNALFRGTNFISQLTAEEKQRILDQNVCQVYKKDGQRVKYKLEKDNEVIQVAAKIDNFNLRADFPAIPPHVCEVLDTTFALAIAAGLEAMKDAGFSLVKVDEVTGEHTIVGLPESQRDDTGVIFASSFPSLDSMTEEVTKSAAAKARNTPDEYEYDRKLLFKLLVMANSQLAELIKARGPNTHINNACSGTTQAISVAEDWIRVGRCKRVIVISADHATSHQLFPYLATGFLALGAASTLPTVTEAAAPFDKRRKGMILGAGAVGLVIETATEASTRSLSLTSLLPQSPLVKAEILGTWISNSAFHASLMDAKTTSKQLDKFISQMEELHGIDRESLAKDLIYFAHETCTHSNGGCAKVELDALSAVFGEKGKQHIVMANTKGFTGHPMGVGIEDVVAVKALTENILPPIANFQCSDPLLGLCDAQLPTHPLQHNRKYILRFAAGFGSQFAYVLYRVWDSDKLPLVMRDGETAAADYRLLSSPLLNQSSQLSFGITGIIPQA